MPKKHLFPKQLERAGLVKGQVKLTEKAIYDMIDRYTSESRRQGLRAVHSLGVPKMRGVAFRRS